MKELRGNNLFHKDWTLGRRQFVPQMMAQEQKEKADRKLALPHNSLQSLPVSFAANAALPELASSGTQDVVLHRNPSILFHDISSETQYLNEGRKNATRMRKISIHYFSSNDDRTD